MEASDAEESFPARIAAVGWETQQPFQRNEVASVYFLTRNLIEIKVPASRTMGVLLKYQRHVPRVEAFIASMASPGSHAEYRAQEIRGAISTRPETFRASALRADHPAGLPRFAGPEHIQFQQRRQHFAGSIAPRPKQLAVVQYSKRGRMTNYTDAHARAGIDTKLPKLETWPNHFPGYVITTRYPEYTSLCPKTGLPDYGVITIEYQPKNLCLELKALKMYLLGYRSLGIFYENAVNRMLRDIIAVVQPVWCRVHGEFTPRGGLNTTVEARWPFRNSNTKRRGR